MMIFSAEYWLACLWGVVVLASWVGWGELVRRVCGVNVGRVGWALRAGWGMAAVLGICGVLLAAGVCDGMALGTIVVIGAVVAGMEGWRELRRPRVRGRWSMGERVAVGALVLLLLYLYATSVVAWDFNWWDDLPNYLVAVKKVLQTGSLIEPFSLRRIVAYGGQQVLGGMVVLGGTWVNVDILDLGLGRVIFAGLVWEIVRPGEKWGRIVCAVGLIVLVLVPRVPLTMLNTQAEMTGVVLLVTLLRTLAMARGGVRMAVVAGVVAGAAGTLRANFLPMGVLSIVLCEGMRVVRSRGAWRRAAANVAVAGVSFAVVLLPWAVELWRSSGTLLYPVWAGNMRPEYTYFDAGWSVVEKVKWVLGFAGYGAGLVLMGPLVLALRRRYWRTELPMAVAAAVSVGWLLWTFTLTEYTNTFRFAFPVAFGVGAVVVMGLAVWPRGRVERWMGIGALVMIGAVNLWPGAWWAFAERGKVWTNAGESPLGAVVGSEKAYRAAQGAVPAGERIFSATSFPVLFDYARNPIWIADVPGAVSPSPGMPIFEGASAVKSYLLGLGVRYVVFTLPEEDRTLYSKTYWEPIFSGERKALADEVRCSKYNVAFIRCMEGLPGVGEVVFRSRTLCVVRLG